MSHPRQFALPILSDSYKTTHYKQYPPGTQTVYSFLESRAGAKWDETTFFGLQYFLMEYLIAAPILPIDSARLIDQHMGPGTANIEGWKKLARDGGLPLRIKAVPEGMSVPVGNVMMTVENTDPDFFWLTNYVESLLVQTWYPSTVCTQSRVMKRRLLRSLEETGDPSLIDFKLHDFGFRGSTSPESAAIGGCAHLVNFKGTDTMPALALARDYYDAGNTVGSELAGFSIPAAEHSTITSWGRDHEADAYENMLDQYPTGLVAVVSDSYNIFDACRDIWGGTLRDRVLARDGVLVIRPDSGDPVSVLRRVFAILEDRFGATVNEKGFKVLNPKVRVIQGDGIDLDMLDAILKGLLLSRWSTDNIAFGSGGGLLQKMNRDTQRIAFKCSFVAGQTDGNSWTRDVMKDPITDPLKRSKAGRLALVKTDSGIITVNESDGAGQDLLRVVFEDGEIVNPTTLAEVRERAAITEL